MSTRREFLESLALVALVPVVGSSSACGGTQANGPTIDSLRDGGPTACTSIFPSIGSNHGHTLDVPLADVQAGNSKTYQLAFNGSHTHTLRVTNVDFAAIANGQNTVVLSGQAEAHQHPVTITCLGMADAGTDSGSADAGNADAGNADAGNADAGPFSCSSVTPTFDFNHGHTLTVPAADVATGTDQTYMLTNNGSHSHMITVTAAQFAILATGASTTGISTTTDSLHAHSITLVCA